MNKIFKNLNPYQIILLSYGIVIFSGTILLMMPFTVKGIPSLNFLEALFMAASATCVSGVSMFDLGNNFTVYGQMVIILLVQIGALGIMTITTVLAVVMGKKIHLRERLLIQESLQRLNVAGVVKLVLIIVKMTMIFELIGGIILTFVFLPDYGLKSVYYGFWHSASAFCNAGFDILGSDNFTNYVFNPVFNFIIILEVICGGLGFAVLMDIYEQRRWKRLNINSKLVLITTATILAIGFILIFTFEFLNPATMGNFPILDKVMSTFFMTAACRTAGFSMFSIDSLSEPTLLLVMFLMFIGGSPASTGGGIKTTTIAVIFAAIWSLIRGREDVVIFERTVPAVVIFRALSIFFVSAIVIFSTSMFLTFTEDEPLAKILFESISMFSTVGLPTGMIDRMNDGSRVLIILVMLMGRIGIISFVTALVIRKKRDKIRYPEDKFIIG